MFKHIKEIGNSNNQCKKCKNFLTIRAKKGKIKPAHYYSQWEYCSFCKAVYFDKKYSV